METLLNALVGKTVKTENWLIGKHTLVKSNTGYTLNGERFSLDDVFAVKAYCTVPCPTIVFKRN